jgi:positive regulator of sigma E activity
MTKVNMIEYKCDICNREDLKKATAHHTERTITLYTNKPYHDGEVVYKEVCEKCFLRVEECIWDAPEYDN